MINKPLIKDGHLYIANVSVRKIFETCAKRESAAYVIDLDYLKDHLSNIQQTIQQTGVPLRLFYAMKANPSPDVLKAVIDAGLGLQVSSIQEIRRALDIDSDAANLSISNDSFGTEVVGRVLNGATLNFESLDQVKDFCLEERGMPIPNFSQHQWGLRLRLPTQTSASKKDGILKTTGKYSHLGIPQEHWGEAVALMQASGKEIRTLHTHIGSSMQMADSHLEALKELLKIAEGINSVENINLGGGMGAAFLPDDTGFPLEEFCLKAKDILDDFEAKTGRKIKIQAEPGEFIVANAGYYLTQVSRVNNEKNGRNVILKGTALQVPLYKAHGQHLPVYINGKEGKTTSLAKVWGSAPHSGDSFGEHSLPDDVEKGNIVLVANTGAYCTPESNYNAGSNFSLRPTPPIIAVSGGYACEIK